MADGSPKTAATHDLELGFGALYRAHARMVRQALRQLGVPPASLDDAVQDVFVVLHRRVDDFQRDRSLKNWLWGIARGVASGYRRGDRRRHRLHAAVPRPEAGASPDRAVARGEATAILDDFLGSLDDDKCTVFVLSEIEGRRGPEIAALLDVNLNTVYARLRAARRRFDAAMARHRAPASRPLFASWLSWSWPAWLGKPAVAVSVGAVAALVTVAPIADHGAPAAEPLALASLGHLEPAPAPAVRSHRRARASLAAPEAASEPAALAADDEPIGFVDDDEPGSSSRPRSTRTATVAPVAALADPAGAEPPESFVGPPPRAPWESRIDGHRPVRHPGLLSVRQDFVDELLRVALGL